MAVVFMLRMAKEISYLLPATRYLGIPQNTATDSNPIPTSNRDWNPPLVVGFGARCRMP